MRPGPWQWVVLFFTRPVRVSDLAALARPFKRREKPVEATAPPVIEVPEAPPSRPRVVAPASGAPRPRVVSLRAQPLEVGGVSEQPLDTFPAELQSEFRNSSKGALDPPRSGAGNYAG